MKRAWDVVGILAIAAWVVVVVASFAQVRIADVVFGVLVIGAIAGLFLMVWPHDDRETRR